MGFRYSLIALNISDSGRVKIIIVAKAERNSSLGAQTDFRRNGTLPIQV